MQWRPGLFKGDVDCIFSKPYCILSARMMPEAPEMRATGTNGEHGKSRFASKNICRNNISGNPGTSDGEPRKCANHLENTASRTHNLQITCYLHGKPYKSHQSLVFTSTLDDACSNLGCDLCCDLRSPMRSQTAHDLGITAI